jgi:putative nucleotidyltransferase with HDIG domain
MIPSVQQCFELMAKYEMLENIKAHSIMVERIASLIARGLQEAGESLSLDLVTAGALMHDIAKTQSLKTKENHSTEGSEICHQNRLDEIAEIVAEHVVLKNFSKEGPVLEKEIVYYADKRVNHDKIVSLEERLAYLIKQYGNGDETLIRRMGKNFDLCKQVESKLFSKLRFAPQAVAGMIQS